MGRKNFWNNWAWKPYTTPLGTAYSTFREKRAQEYRKQKNRKKGDRRKRKPHPFYDSDRWLRLRYDILKRDGAQCRACGASPPDVVLHVDHIVPRSKNPALQWEPSNLQVLCQYCNLGKSNRDSKKWP